MRLYIEGGIEAIPHSLGMRLEGGVHKVLKILLRVEHIRGPSHLSPLSSPLSPPFLPSFSPPLTGPTPNAGPCLLLGSHETLPLWYHLQVGGWRHKILRKGRWTFMHCASDICLIRKCAFVMRLLCGCAHLEQTYMYDQDYLFFLFLFICTLLHLCVGVCHKIRPLLLDAYNMWFYVSIAHSSGPPPTAIFLPPIAGFQHHLPVWLKGSWLHALWQDIWSRLAKVD